MVKERKVTRVIKVIPLLTAMTKQSQLLRRSEGQPQPAIPSRADGCWQAILLWHIGSSACMARCRHTDAVHGREQKTIVRMLEEDKGHTGYLSFATLMHPEARVPLVLRTQSSVETSEQSPSS